MITRKLFDSIFPTNGLTSPVNLRRFNLVRRRDELIAALNKFLPIYEITTSARVCAFLSCCGVETDYFRTTEEYASGANYNFRTDLGNIFPGDGQKYKGSSLIQTTGRYNFWRVTVRFVKKLTGKDWSPDEKKYKTFAAYVKSSDYAAFLKEATRLNVNFLEHPERLRDDIEIAVEAACIFWQENDLNFYADRGRVRELNGIVNRGDKDKTALHWDKRNELYSLCKRRIPKDFSFDAHLMTDDNSVALTPTGVSDSTANSTPELVQSGAAATSLKELGTTVFLHCPKDTVKNIFVVILTRILAGIVAIWSFGLHGQIFLVAAAVIASAAIVYACIRYAPRLLNWSKQALEYVFN